MQEEIWKDVIGFEEFFQVSNLGNVFSKRTHKLLSQTVGKTGYYQVATKIGGRKGKCYCFKVHRLVADAFLAAPIQDLVDKAEKTVYKKVIVNHKDCNKLNNLPSNLEWCSHSYNSKHAVDNGLIEYPSGLNCSRYSLDAEQVQFVKDFYIPYSRDFGQRALSIKLGISRSAIEIAINI